MNVSTMSLLPLLWVENDIVMMFVYIPLRYMYTSSSIMENDDKLLSNDSKQWLVTEIVS